MAADKPYPKQPEGLTLGGSGIPPKFGTFTPPADYLVGQDADIEKLLQTEQDVLATIIGDAVAMWGSAGCRVERATAAEADLRRRAGDLSLSARITARTLTRLWLDAKHPLR